MLAFEPINNFTVSRILFKPHLNALLLGSPMPLDPQPIQQHGGILHAV